MLPTDQRPTNGNILLLHKNKLYKPLTGAEFRKFIANGFVPQHLYFTSNEEAKDGDLVIPDYPYNNSVWKFKEAPCPLPYWGNKKTCKKIIASTDVYLGCPEGEKSTISHLYPQANVDFIDTFMSEFNKGILISEVLIKEVVDYSHNCYMSVAECRENQGNNMDCEGCHLSKTKLFVDDDDFTVNVIYYPNLPVDVVDEKLYTPTEVKQKMKDAMSFILLNPESSISETKEWIDECVPLNLSEKTPEPVSVYPEFPIGKNFIRNYGKGNFYNGRFEVRGHVDEFIVVTWESGRYELIHIKVMFNDLADGSLEEYVE